MWIFQADQLTTIQIDYMLEIFNHAVMIKLYANTTNFKVPTFQLINVLHYYYNYYNNFAIFIISSIPLLGKGLTLVMYILYINNSWFCIVTETTEV